MKRIIFLTICALLISVSNLCAQTEGRVFVYGVDFSNVKVHAADESVEEFAKAFERINLLLITEPQKYDFSRVLDKRTEVVIEPMLKHLSECDYNRMKTYSSNLDSLNVPQVIKNYSLPQTEGTGLVVIARKLNRAKAEATYELVVFDIGNREIIKRHELVSRAGGAGLRNFWANSLYKVIKKTKFYL